MLWTQWDDRKPVVGRGGLVDREDAFGPPPEDRGLSIQLVLWHDAALESGLLSSDRTRFALVRSGSSPPEAEHVCAPLHLFR